MTGTSHPSIKVDGSVQPQFPHNFPSRRGYLVIGNSIFKTNNPPWLISMQIVTVFRSLPAFSIPKSQQSTDLLTKICNPLAAVVQWTLAIRIQILGCLLLNLELRSKTSATSYENQHEMYLYLCATASVCFHFYFECPFAFVGLEKCSQLSNEQAGRNGGKTHG